MDEDGKSHWVFESRKVSRCLSDTFLKGLAGQRAIISSIENNKVFLIKVSHMEDPFEKTTSFVR